MTWKERWKQEGGPGEILRLAVPFILSSSFMTLQITIDRALLSQASTEAAAASIPGAMLYWTPFMLFQNIANYATTFAAQYSGAGRKKRVGPVIWQSLYFSVTAGLLFLLLLFAADWLIGQGGHSPPVQALESAYFRILCFAALPALIVASCNSFFAGRGDSWTVLLIDATGMSVNAILAYGMIFGQWGMPGLGIRGAGWATVIGSSTSALLGLSLFFRRRHREEFATLNWRFEPALFLRLIRFGFPNGLQFFLEMLAFTVFIFLIGMIGEVELAASNIAFTINMVGILPMMGMGQAAMVLVGQRLGQDRPELAERSTWNGLWLAVIYIGSVCVLYVALPDACYYFFRNDADPNTPQLAALVPVLLLFAALYSGFDSMNIVFSFALRGAGDTRFVTLVSLSLIWPMMVLPTWAAWHYQWRHSLYWAWASASAYIISMAFIFLFRFRTGKWQSMRVIEAAPAKSPLDVEPAELTISESAVV